MTQAARHPTHDDVAAARYVLANADALIDLHAPDDWASLVVTSWAILYEDRNARRVEYRRLAQLRAATPGDAA